MYLLLVRGVRSLNKENELLCVLPSTLKVVRGSRFESSRAILRCQPTWLAEPEVGSEADGPACERINT